MMKKSVFRPPTPGSAVFFTAPILFNSGVLMPTNALHFEVLEPLAIAENIDEDTDYPGLNE